MVLFVTVNTCEDWTLDKNDIFTKLDVVHISSSLFCTYVEKSMIQQLLLWNILSLYQFNKDKFYFL